MQRGALGGHAIWAACVRALRFGPPCMRPRGPRHIYWQGERCGRRAGCDLSADDAVVARCVPARCVGAGRRRTMGWVRHRRRRCHGPGRCVRLARLELHHSRPGSDEHDLPTHGQPVRRVQTEPVLPGLFRGARCLLTRLHFRRRGHLPRRRRTPRHHLRLLLLLRGDGRAGMWCPGDCSCGCGGVAVNRHSQACYERAIAPVLPTLNYNCNCPACSFESSAGGGPVCVQGVCTVPNNMSTEARHPG
jgi:hypothetical protein